MHKRARRRERYCGLLELMQERCADRGLSFTDEMSALAGVWLSAESIDTGTGSISDSLCKQGIPFDFSSVPIDDKKKSDEYEDSSDDLKHFDTQKDKVIYILSDGKKRTKGEIQKETGIPTRSLGALLDQDPSFVKEKAEDSRINIWTLHKEMLWALDSELIERDNI